MQREAIRSFGPLTAAAPIAAAPRFRPSFTAAIKFVVVTIMLFNLLGVEIMLRVAPRIGIISNFAIVWFVWTLLSAPKSIRHDLER